MTNKNNKLAPLVIGLIILVLGRCQDYQEKTYIMTASDSLACNQLQDTNFVSLTAAKLSLIDTSWSAAAIDSLIETDLDSIMDSLESCGNLIDTVGAFNYAITFQGVDDAYYLVLKVDISNETEVSIYVDNYVNLRLWDTQGQGVTLIDDSLPLEVVADCHEIAGRFRYNLASGRYLMEIDPGDQMKSDHFKMTMIYQTISMAKVLP